MGGRGGGSRHGSSPPPPGSPARTLSGCRGVACSPRLRPPPMAGGVEPRVPPCRVLGRGCLAAPGTGRDLAGRPWVSLVGGGGGGWCPAPRRWLGRGGAGGRGAGGRSASVGPSASPGRASKRAAPALPCPWGAWSPYCTGSRPCAAAWMRSVGCPCAPAQGCWPVAVIVGGGGWRTWGARRTGPVAPLLVCRGPLEGGGFSPGPAGGMRGRRPPGRPPAVRVLGGGEGGREEGGGAPRCPPPVPVCCSPVAAGGRPDGLGPWVSRCSKGGGCTSLLLPFHRPGVRLSCGPTRTGPPLPSSPSPRRVAPAWGGGGGSASAGGGGLSQQLLISGLRVNAVPVSRASACSWPPPSPLPVAARVLPLYKRRGGRGGPLGRGTQGCHGGVRRRWSSPTPL